MRNKNVNNESLIISYLTLRKVIGILGITFPFILSLGAIILFQTGTQSSISAYYYTKMGDVFVGTLCVIGFFLFSYKGHNRIDDIAGDLACVFAIGVAFFPTTPDGGGTSSEQIIGYFHLAFAALFFLILIYFSLCLFTKTDPDLPPTDEKLKRNIIYRICGYAMSICIFQIVIYKTLPDIAESLIGTFNPVFWLEALTVIAFGISWFVKGEAILQDKK